MSVQSGVCDRRNKWLFGALSKKVTRQKEEKHEEIYTECMLILLIKFPCRIFRFESPWWLFTRLAPNDRYRGRTAPLTSKRCILYIYSTNIGTEYFMVYTLRFFLFKMQFVS